MLPLFTIAFYVFIVEKSIFQKRIDQPVTSTCDASMYLCAEIKGKESNTFLGSAETETEPEKIIETDQNRNRT